MFKEANSISCLHGPDTSLLHSTINYYIVLYYSLSRVFIDFDFFKYMREKNK